MNKQYIKPTIVIVSLNVLHLLEGSDHGSKFMQSREDSNHFDWDTDDEESVNIWK